MLAMTLITALALAGTGQVAGAEGDGGRAKGEWTPLFNGRDLDGWYTFLQKHGKDRDPDGVITIEEGSIRLYKNAEDKSEVVMGYIATEKEYGDYHLRLRYRWGTKKFQPRSAMKRDAGLYYHLIGPDAIWPRALQFQVQQTDVGDLVTQYGLQLDTWIDPRTRDEKESTFRPADEGGEPTVLGGKDFGYQKRLPGDFEVEGWNTAEVIALADATTHILNGHVVNRGRKIRLVDPADPKSSKPITKGRIALEIEAAELDFRDVEIRSLGAARPDGASRK